MKTSKLLCTLLLILSAAALKAQDVITFKTGDELKAKVLEVGTAEVKYKKAENMEGPVYTVSKGEVFMIKYANGAKDVFSAPSLSVAPPADKKESKSDYDKDRHLYHKKLVTGIVMTALGAPLIPAGAMITAAGFIGAGTGIFDNGFFPATPVLIIVGTTMLGAGIPLTTIGAIKISRAKKMKPQLREEKATMGFSPVFAPSPYGQAFRAGAGLRINF